MNDRRMLRMQMQEEDIALRRLLESDCQIEGALLLDAYLSSSPEATPPEALDQLCQSTIRKHFHKKARQRKLCRLARSAACFLLVIATMGMMTLFLSPEVRASVSSWISGWEGGLYVYAPTDTDEITPDYNYRITAVPEGYHFNQEYFVPTGGVVRYSNEEGTRSLHFVYCRQEEGSEFGLILTEESHKNVSVNGISADLYYYPDLHDDSSLVWLDPETNYLLHISGYFPEEEMIAIAQSVVRTLREAPME